MNFNQLIEQIATDFVTLWNARNLDKMRSQMAQSIVLVSPKVQDSFPNYSSNRIEGIEDVHEHFKKLAERESNHQFDIDSLYFHKEDNFVRMHGKFSHVPVDFICKFTLNEYGKLKEIMLEY